MKFFLKNFLLEFIKLTIISVVISVVIALYRYTSHYIISLSRSLFLSDDIYTKTFAVILAVFLVFISFLIIRFEGTVQSGGLSQLKLMLTNKNIKFRYYFAIPLMFINSLISFFIGAPVGSEAPSVFMGGSISYGVDEIFYNKKSKNDDDYLGMALGFSMAFNAPFAGLLYGLEECLHNIKIKNIMKMIYLLSISYLISMVICPDPVFSFEIAFEFDFSKIYIFIFLIILNFLISALILFLVPTIKKILNKHYLNKFVQYRFFLLAGISIILSLFFPILAGNGTQLINYVFANPMISLIIIFLIIRVILFIISANSMMTGGLVLPALAIGALNGYLGYYIANICFDLNSTYITLFVLIGMVSMFSCLNEAPLTGIILALSFSNFSNWTTVLVVSSFVIFVCFIFIKLCRLDDITDSRFKLLKTSRKE